jgi:CII-binding regulator of phage lambda lysogenization HflD
MEKSNRQMAERLQSLEKVLDDEKSTNASLTMDVLRLEKKLRSDGKIVVSIQKELTQADVLKEIKKALEAY